MSFTKPMFSMLAVACLSMTAWAADNQIPAATRWATFENADGQYFALAVQPDAKADVPHADALAVAVVVDTSATQTGPVRIESLEVVDELVNSVWSHREATRGRLLQLG